MALTTLALDRFFDEAFMGFPRRLSDAPRTWVPAMDIHDSEKELVVRADIPGVQKDDLEVEVHEGVLTISGERKLEKTEEKDGEVVRTERTFGSFSRSFRLPEDVDSESVQATYKDGVLEIRLSKAPKALPTRITIQ